MMDLVLFIVRPLKSNMELQQNVHGNSVILMPRKTALTPFLRRCPQPLDVVWVVHAVVVKTKNL